MKRIALFVFVVTILGLTAGCADFWDSYYWLQPGVSDMKTVRKQLGNPFLVEGNRWTYLGPKPTDTQYMELFFDQRGILVAQVRHNPGHEPPVGIDVDSWAEEVIGKVPPYFIPTPRPPEKKRTNQ